MEQWLANLFMPTPSPGSGGGAGPVGDADVVPGPSLEARAVAGDPESAVERAVRGVPNA